MCDGVVCGVCGVFGVWVVCGRCGWYVGCVVECVVVLLGGGLRGWAVG